MLKQVHFAGIKSLLDVTVDLERFTVLVGPNGAGKTTVIEQIAAMARMTSTTDPTPTGFGGAADSLAALGADRLRTKGFAGTQIWEARNTAGWFKVNVEAGKTDWQERATCAAVPRFGGAHGQNTFPVCRRPPRPEFDEEIEKVSFRAHRVQLARAAILTPSPLLQNLMAPGVDGGGLPSVLAHLKLSDTPTFDAIMRDLALVVPRFQTLRFPIVPITPALNGYALELLFEAIGPIPADLASEGTLFALALLTVLHTRDFPGLVLIDDIDHGLHLNAQFAIIESIRRVMKVREDLQVVCTSHSPVLVDSFEPHEVRVMALNPAGHTALQPLTAHPKFERYNAMLQTGELWGSTGEDWVVDASAGK